MKTTRPLSTTLLRDALGSIELSDGELVSFAEALCRRWYSVIRHRREVRPDRIPLAGKSVAWYALARQVMDGDKPAKPSRYLSYAAGDYYLQDAGSLLSLAAAGADTSTLSDGWLICDLCAAPGGKASALVEAIGDAGFVLANEPIRSRIAALQFNLARTGSDRFAVSCLDPQVLADRVGGVFDLVLVDAPCSGQALVSRGRQSTSALSDKQISHSAARQNRILDAAMRLLRSDGQLIYSTCTFAEAENESQVTRLIDSGIAESRSVDRLADYQSVLPACYRLWPHRHACAGSFAASLTAVRGGPAVAEDRTSRHKRDEPPTDLSQWFESIAESTRTRSFDSVIVGWPSDTPPWIDDLAISGPELAHRTGQTWKPSHAASLRRVARMTSLQSVEVNAEVAKRFMLGETIPCQGVGWHVVKWEDRPLGWIKSNGTMGKNHLPASARMTGEILG